MNIKEKMQVHKITTTKIKQTIKKIYSPSGKFAERAKL